MNKPFRLRVLEALTAALQEITIENGYQHDLSTSVFRGRDLFGEDDPVPMVVVLESADQADPIPQSPGNPQAAGRWQLLIQGFVDNDIENPTDPAHYLMADVKTCLAKVRKDRRDMLGMGGRVYELRFSNGVVRPPDGISEKAYFWLQVALELAEITDDPFA